MSRGAPPSDRTVRVLSVAPYLDRSVGGAEQYASEVERRLASSPDVDLYRVASDTGSDTARPILRVGSTGFHPAWSSQLDRLLARFDPDVVYAHHTVPGFTDVAVRRAARREVAVALMYHSDVTGADPLRRLAGRAYRVWPGGGTLAAASLLFASSRSYAERSPALREARARVVEAPPGVGREFSETLEGPPRRGTRRIVFVGKPSSPHKGLNVLLHAWRRRRTSWPEHELTLVGDIDAAFADEPQVTRAGRIDDRRALADVYASADVTVLPSLVPESFGMVVAEALLSGCPVVASDLGGVPTLVNDGVNGRLVPAGDVAALETALDDVLRQRSAYRARVASERASMAARFDWDRTAAIVEDELLRLAARPHRKVPAPVVAEVAT